MSFGNFLKDAAKGTAKALVEKGKEMNELNSQYENLSDDELLSIARSSGWSAKSSTEKNLATAKLKKRGYTQEDISNL